MSRYEVPTSRGESGIRTDSLAEAERYRDRWDSHIIDTETSCVPSA